MARPRDDRGPFWRDIRDFGASTGDTLADARANRKAIQAAIRSLAGKGPDINEGVVYIPAGRWLVDRPIRIDIDGITIKGEGVGRSIIKNYYTNYSSLFWAGMKQTVALSPDHYVDLFGKLDPSVAPAAGKAYGFRTKGDCHVAHGSSPYQAPPGQYDSLRWLTIDIALEYLTPGGMPDQPICGMSKDGRGAPWMLNVRNGLLDFHLFTKDGTLHGGTARFYTFAQPTTAGVHRVSIQVDLEGGAVLAWVDRTRVAVDGTLPAGSYLQANMCEPFKIGAGPSSGGSAWLSELMTVGDPARRDLAIYGLRCGNAKKYADTGGVGSAQARIDGQALDDARQFLGEWDSFGWMTLGDDPSESAAERWLTMGVSTIVGSWSTAYVAQINQGDAFLATSGTAFRDVGLVGGYDGGRCVGDAITFGVTTELTVERCKLFGAGFGIGTWNWGVAYTIYLKDCPALVGNTAAIYGNYNQIDARYINIPIAGRAAIWTGPNSTFKGYRVWIDSAVYQRCDYVIRGDEGAHNRIEKCSADFEGGRWPTNALIYAKSGSAAGNPDSGSLILHDFAFGATDGNKPAIVLEDTSPTDRAMFRLDDILILGQDYEALIRTSSTVWRGECSTPELRESYPMINCTNADGRTGVVSRHRRLIGPPVDSKWYRGAHILDVPAPADGQYQQWRCVDTGTYGTPNPPLWKGYDPCDGQRNGLATYLLGHGYWSYSGTGAGIGCYTDFAQHQFLTRLLRGAAVSPPQVLYAGLSTDRVYRNGAVSELNGSNGPGYNRVVVLANEQQQIVFGGAPSGGTYTLTARGQTTGALAFNANAPTIKAALESLTSVGPGNVAVSGTFPTFTVTFQGALGYQPISPLAADSAGLTGGLPAVSIQRTRPGVAPVFAASSGGATSNTQGITFPAATADWKTVRSMFLINEYNQVVAALDLAPYGSPLTVSAGSSLVLAPGSIQSSATRRHRAFGDSVLDATNDFWLRGSSPTAPSLYVALSTAPADVTIAPNEPVGNNYARVAVPGPAIAVDNMATGTGTSNSVALTFPAPSGPWGTVRSAYLMDAPSGGRVVAAADLTIPQTPAAGNPAPSFAPGALWLNRS